MVISSQFLAKLRHAKSARLDYDHAVMIQRLAFLLAEIPGQMLVMRFGFRVMLPGLMMCWGTVCK